MNGGWWVVSLSSLCEHFLGHRAQVLNVFRTVHSRDREYVVANVCDRGKTGMERPYLRPDSRAPCTVHCVRAQDTPRDRLDTYLGARTAEPRDLGDEVGCTRAENQERIRTQRRVTVTVYFVPVRDRQSRPTKAAGRNQTSGFRTSSHFNLAAPGAPKLRARETKIPEPE